MIIKSINLCNHPQYIDIELYSLLYPYIIDKGEVIGIDPRGCLYETEYNDAYDTICNVIYELYHGEIEKLQKDLEPSEYGYPVIKFKLPVPLVLICI